MRAAYIEQVGSPESIIIGELPVPTISSTEVLVKVTYTTVNHIDTYIRSGKYPQTLPQPFIIGRDFCGEVVEVGAEVTRFKVGERVWSHLQGINGKQGTFAEFIRVSEDSIFTLPDQVKPEDAITVFHSAFTALLGLKREAQISNQDTLFVHGAAGNVGAMVIQIAKSLGARVIASTSGQEKMDYCKSLGADAVLDYTTDFINALRNLAPQGVNVFWNTSRHHDFKTYIPLLALKGRYILMAGSGTESILPIGDLYTRDASIRGYTITNANMAEIQRSGAEINALFEKGGIQGKTNTVLTLDDARVAHQLLEKGEIWGKVVIKM